MMLLWMMPPSTFKVTGVLLLKVKRKPLRKVPVTLKMYRLWRRTMPELFSSRLFYFYFILYKDFGEQLISNFNRCPLYLNFSLFMGFNNIYLVCIIRLFLFDEYVVGGCVNVINFWMHPSSSGRVMLTQCDVDLVYYMDLIVIIY